MCKLSPSKTLILAFGFGAVSRATVEAYLVVFFFFDSNQITIKTPLPADCSWFSLLSLPPTSWYFALALCLFVDMRSTTTTPSISDDWSDIDADSDDSYSMVEALSDSGFNSGAGTGLAPATTTVPKPTNLPAQGPLNGSHITAGPGTGPDTQGISTVPDAEEADDAQFLSETVTGDTVEASSEAHGEDASATETEEEEEEEEARAQLRSYPFHGDKARGISSQLLDYRQAMLQIRDHPAVHSRVHGVILGALNHVLESTCGPGPHLSKFIAGSHDYHAFLVRDTSGYSIEHSPCLHEPIVAACLELRNKLDGPDGSQDIVGAVGSLGDLLMTWTK